VKESEKVVGVSKRVKENLIESVIKETCERGKEETER
jgi:hypothetical protein